MDRLSSPTSVTPPPAAERTPVSKQPTYTTAGTIYNPNASQPLQPPTRRGRSFKWSNGGVSTELALLPRSVLATLPLRGANSRVPIFQQYSPLQQNYDRAVSPSPFQDMDLTLAKMPLRELLDDPSNASASVSTLCVGSGGDRPGNKDGSDEDDTDDDFVTNPLMGMTVKSLQNLASYPNPNQKGARKALLGAKTAQQGIGISSRNPVSPRTSSIRPIGSPTKSDAVSSETIPPVPPAQPPLQRLRVTSRGNPETGREGSSGTLDGLIESKFLGRSTLSDGPGAPLPLTAGPPGQRQYRPSTFESTFKALQTTSQQTKGPELEDDGLRASRDSHVKGGMSERYPPMASCTPPGFQCRGSTTASPQPTTMADRGLLTKEQSLGAIDLIQISQPGSASLLKEKAPAYTVDPSKPWIPNVRDSRPENLIRFEPGTDRLSKLEIGFRNERIRRWWYSGSGILDKSTRDTMADARYRKLEHRLGVIGDGRPTKTKARYRRINIEEAKRMNAAEHAKPLLNMTFASIVRYTEEYPPKTMKDNPAV